MVHLLDAFSINTVLTTAWSASTTIRVGSFAGSASEWNQCVRSQSQWTHFHLYGWRSVLERVFKHECMYLEARDSNGALRS